MSNVRRYHMSIVFCFGMFRFVKTHGIGNMGLLRQLLQIDANGWSMLLR